MAPVRLDERTKMAAFSGFGWGLLVYLIGYPIVEPWFWGGIAASPLIGILMGHLARSYGTKPSPLPILSSLFVLYLAASCFAVATGTTDFFSQRIPVTLPAALMAHLWAACAILTGSGIFLLLWPLAFFNHQLLWQVELGRSAVPPQIPLTSQAFQTLALHIIPLSVTGCVAWSAFQLLTVSEQLSDSPWWIFIDLMGWSNWATLGALVWLTAPLLALLATKAAGSPGPLTRTYAELVCVIGFAVLASPFLFWVARLIVVAIKMTLVQSWHTEGPVFAEAQYYRNVFWMHCHYLVVGFVLITLRWLTTNARDGRFHRRSGAQEF